MKDSSVRNEHDYYTCPMHPEVKQDQPGRCPKCGGMELVKKSQLQKGQASHDHTAMMTGPKPAAQFLRRFLVVTFLLIPLLLLSRPALRFLALEDFAWRRYLQFGVATIIFYFSLIFFEHAKHEIKARQYGMMTLVSLAVGAGYLFSVASTFLPQLDAQFYLEISSLIWVLLFGHYLEARSGSAAGDALQEVAQLLPKQAHLLVDEQVQEVDPAQLKEGDVVLVKPGEKVPADGVILRGKANLNEALISGESLPVEKSEGQEVVAGSICLDGSLEVKLNRVGQSSTIGQIQALIAQAQKTKPTAQKIADRASKYLTFTALGVGILAIVIWSVVLGQPFVFAITLGITVLVIACPHALGLAIPTVSTIATSLAVKNGVFIKDLSKLEIIKEVDYVILDKTGTLTKGEFGVTEIVQSVNPGGQTQAVRLEGKEGEQRILQVAASLEQHSSHVIGQAFMSYAKERGILLQPLQDFKNLAGKGIMGLINQQMYYIGNEALMEEQGVNLAPVREKGRKWADEGKTVVFLAKGSEIIGAFALSDTIREESKSAIARLHQLGLKVALLTGDSREAAQAVAGELGIDTYFAQVLPEDKYKKVRELQLQGNKVMMVGDGVNDAPALTQADVGVAIGAGTDVAVESGDVVLTRNNPEDIARVIVLAKKVYRKMVENLIWALGYNLVALPAAAGVFAPWGFFLRPEVGALLMSLSSVIVVVNAMWLKRLKLA